MLVKLSEPNLEGVTSRSAAYFSEVSAAVQAFRGAVEGATAISSQPMPACSLILIATSSSAPRAAGVTGEEAIVSVESGGQPNPRYDDPTFRLGFARLVTHYFSHSHAAWLSDNQLLAYTDHLVDIPGVLIHDQLDLGSPPSHRLATRAGLA